MVILFEEQNYITKSQESASHARLKLRSSEMWRHTLVDKYQRLGEICCLHFLGVVAGNASKQNLKQVLGSPQRNPKDHDINTAVRTSNVI